MRRNRAFNKRIEIWQTTNVADGYGGYTTTNLKIAESWAKIQTTDIREGAELSVIGVNDPTKAIRITLRHRNDITYNAKNMYVVYGGNTYAITTEPIVRDFMGSFIEIIAVRINETEVAQYTPLEWYQDNYEEFVSQQSGTIENDECLTSEINNIENGL